MSELQKPRLQVIIVSGPEAPERATLGMAAALSACHSDYETHVVLAMRGAIWAAETEGNSPLVPGYPPMGEMIALVHDAGGTVLGCSSCIHQYCPAPTGDDGQKILRKGIALIGLTQVTMNAIEVSTLTF